MPSIEVKNYWSRVVDEGCMVCKQPAQIHHVRGGSCSGLAGVGLKASDWLVIPLCMNHHTGREGIHQGVLTWEEKHGLQRHFLLRIGARFGTLKIIEGMLYGDERMDYS